MQKPYNIKFTTSEDYEVFYLKIKDSIGETKKQIRISNYFDYSMPDIYLDINEKDNLVGIEIIL